MDNITVNKNRLIKGIKRRAENIYEYFINNFNNLDYKDILNVYLKIRDIERQILEGNDSNGNNK